MAALAFLALLASVAALSALWTPHDPNAQDCAAGALRGPYPEHLLGTDALCRDVLSRLMVGARISLTVGVVSQAVIFAVALTIGALAALGGRVADHLLMRLTDLTFAFPDLLMIILLRRVLEGIDVPGGSVAVVLGAIALVGWAGVARLVRGQFLTLKGRDYVLAARALGASPGRIVLVHLLPNALGPILVTLVFGVPLAIFAEASLGFIGLGVDPPTASWGRMVDEGYAAVFARPALVLYPAAAVTLTVLAFSLLGDGLRDALDPRTTLPAHPARAMEPPLRFPTPLAAEEVEGERRAA